MRRISGMNDGQATKRGIVQLRPVGTAERRLCLVPQVAQLGEVGGQEHSAHPLAETCGVGFALVPGLGHVRRDVRVLPKYR